MQLKAPIKNIFAQLTESLRQLSGEEYSRQVNVLSGASVGQHVRHVIELFQCLESGYATGVVNYEKRKRDHRIETNRYLAIELAEDICYRIERPNIDLVLVAEDYECDTAPVAIPTNYYREIAYNLEHMIHHMALIRIGISEVSDIKLPGQYGVAYSTVKYRGQCAQ